MFPVLLSFGPVALSSLGVLLVVAWAVFSFLFWRALRASGTPDDRIFDLTFYSTIALILCARAAFVLMNWDIFAGSVLKIFAIWVEPGLSWYAGLVGAIATLVYLSRSYKVRLGLVLDALGISLPIALAFGKLGSFLDGAEIGRPSSLPWAVSYPTAQGLRHPVQLYEIAALMLLSGVMMLLYRRSQRQKWPYGLLGVCMFLLFSPLMFALELVKESSVYWVITANQWILIGFFAESLGALYVRGGGREMMRPRVRHITESIRQKGQTIYAAISKRGSRRDTQTS